MISAMRLGGTALSVVALVAVNLIPLVGVAFWGWSLMMILVLYWLESGIVGVINVFKIARAQGGSDEHPVTVVGNRVTIRMTGIASSMSRAPLIGFFILHYGIFWAVHGVFVFLMPLFAGLTNPVVDPFAPGFGIGPMDFGPLPFDGLVLSTGLLAASHVVSYFTNYIGRGEYLRATPAGQMMSVYGRVVVLHLTIILGAFVIGAFGTPIAALVLLVGLKTLIDVGLHLREHRAAFAGDPSPPASRVSGH
jgi:hypothetical protein